MPDFLLRLLIRLGLGDGKPFINGVPSGNPAETGPARKIPYADAAVLIFMKSHSAASLLFFACACAMVARAEPLTTARPTDAERVIGPITNTFTSLPPSGFWAATAAPLMGNGDMGVCLLGGPDRLHFMLGKNDFWRLKMAFGETSALNFGDLLLTCPQLKGARLSLSQKPFSALTAGSLTAKDGAGVDIQTFVAATANVLVVRLTGKGKALDLDAALTAGTYRFKEKPAKVPPTD